MVVRMKKEMVVDEVLPTWALLERSHTGHTLGLDSLISKVAVAAAHLPNAP